MNKSRSILLTILGSLSLAVFSNFILFPSQVLADEPAASQSINASVIVPDACTLSGTGMTSHNAEIANGTSNSNIGETTLKAYCNDNEGFAIYAIGYTDNTDGKNVLTNSTLGSTHDIATGTGTSGNSKWAMKVTTVSSPTPTYPITIQNSFDSFHTVPDDYALVAKRTAGTDIGTNAEGSTLKTTYQAYISNTQLAATYTGQVKYVLVHPNDIGAPAHEDEIVVNYDGNGLTFANNATKNRVIYGEVCSPMYIASTPEVVETANLTNGVKHSSYTSGENVLSTKTYPGAEQVRVVVDYGITANTAGLDVAEGIWDGDWNTLPDTYYEIYSDIQNLSGTETYTINGDTITIYIDTFGTPITNYDYGFHVRVYPIYDTEEPDTEELPICHIDSVTNNYATTTSWKGVWYLNQNQKTLYFDDEAAIIEYLDKNKDSLLGTIVTVYASQISYGKLDTGLTICNKLWALTNSDLGCNEVEARNNLIKSIQMASALKPGFIPSNDNTISLSSSPYPVYAWFDNNYEVGTLYIYTEADKIRLNADSSMMFYGNDSLTDISGLADWDTSGVKNMSYMFTSNNMLSDVSKLANWDVGNVVDMSSMFANTFYLNDISSLANWDVSNTMNLSYMFSLSGVNAAPASWNINPNADTTRMFFGGM